MCYASKFIVSFRAGPICRVNSILELWAYNETIIRGITEEMIYQTVNQEIIQRCAEILKIKFLLILMP